MYGAGVLFYLFHFLKKSDGAQKAATTTLSIATLLHVAYVVALGIILGRHPMATIFEFMSFVAMSMAVIYLFLETLYRNRYMGAFIVPAIFVLQCCSSVGLDVSSTLVPMLKEVRFALHATMFASAYAAFFLAVLFAVMLLLFDRALKRKNYGIVFEQLPSLDVLVQMTMGATAVGFVFMSIGLGFGAYNATNLPSGFQMDPKIILTALVWLFYGFVMIAHFVLRWSDRATAILNFVGFVLLALSTVVSHVTFSSWHQFVG